MANRTSCYIRIPFEVDADDLAGWNFMTLQMRYDDGFVAYLNGTQIASVERAGRGVVVFLRDADQRRRRGGDLGELQHQRVLRRVAGGD